MVSSTSSLEQLKGIYIQLNTDSPEPLFFSSKPLPPCFTMSEHSCGATQVYTSWKLGNNLLYSHTPTSIHLRFCHIFPLKHFSNPPVFHFPLPQLHNICLLEDYQRFLANFLASTFALTSHSPFYVFLKLGNIHMI